MNTLKILLILCVTAGLAGCGSDGPTAPDPGGGTQSDTPVIPKPSSPGGSVPARSNVATLIGANPLEQFAPRLVDIERVNVAVQARKAESCDWVTIDTALGISLSSFQGTQSFAGSLCGTFGLATFFWNRQELHPVANVHARITGSWQPGFVFPERTLVHSGFPVGTLQVRLAVVPETVPTGEGPYLRRDRYWVQKPVEGQVGNFLLLSGPVAGEVSTTYTAGVSQTETQSFGASITGTVGLSYGVLSASVSATLSEEFSTAVTISSEKSETFTKSVQGEEGKIVQFMVWELVEEYSLSDASGEPYQLEGWTIENDKLTIKGAALALEATVFQAR
jgi:hypothetical protein